jgi:gliding motility-associated peptidyl-prolyl isomerase
MFKKIIFIFIFVSCNNPVPRQPIVRKTSTILNESVSFNKSLIVGQEADFKKYIKKDSLNNYFASDYGFWYKFDVKNNEDYLPKNGDEVIYSYEIYNINNQLIYSADVIGIQKYIVDKQEIVEGLREGLKLMSEGDKGTFLFPSHKVFGYLGDQNKININQPLIYKVQLIKINKKNESN